MSASEKLLALERKAQDEELDIGWDNDIIGEPLVSALSQIRAVVEAAEDSLVGISRGDRYHSPPHQELRSALALLERALEEGTHAETA